MHFSVGELQGKNESTGSSSGCKQLGWKYYIFALIFKTLVDNMVYLLAVSINIVYLTLKCFVL